MRFRDLFKVYDIEENGNHYTCVLVDDFLNFLKERDGKYNKWNTTRFFKNLKGGIKSFKNNEKDKELTVQAVPVSSVLKYCFSFCESSKACLFVTNALEKEVLPTTKTPLQLPSSYELYKLISKTKFLYFDKTLEKLDFEEKNIETLITSHKTLFSVEEWRKICYFEHHFYNTHEYNYDLGDEERIRLKYDKFQQLLDFKNCSEELKIQVLSDIKQRTKRIEKDRECHEEVVVCSAKHLPIVIERDLKEHFQSYLYENVQHAICFDTETSQQFNTLSVVIATKHAITDQQKLIDLCKHAFYYLKNKHGTYTENIYLVQANTVSKYISSDNVTYSRFVLRDDIETLKFQDFFFSWNYNELKDNTELICQNETPTRCENCYDVENKIKQLSAKTFDTLKEWYIETPAEIQILLETFINKDSFFHAKNSAEFLQQKLKKLYIIYDSLLNVTNKNYIGVHQVANTEELLIEYKSISSVFDVTSHSGTTSSLSLAESNLKEKATEELCYFNTYLKQHPLQYTTNLQDTKDSVNLRQCHLILMLDNLVRTTNVTDPNPGVAKHKQLCSLPITLQGLPLDAEITNSWHGADCDGTDECICKAPELLGKDDMNSVLLSLNQNEQNINAQFSRLMTWGVPQVWKYVADQIMKDTEDAEEGIVQDVQDAEPNMSLDNSRELDHEQTMHEEATIRDPEQTTEEDIDLFEVLQSIEKGNSSDTSESDSASDFSDFETDILSELEKSMGDMSILETQSDKSILSILSYFGFKKFFVPPLLTRHPPPAHGRDDDMSKIKEICDEVLVKMGYTAHPKKRIHRILCGPDNKIGKCLFDMMEMDAQYQVFLPEFPLLHLRKSKITVLFSAYKDAGIVEILQYMRDDANDDWKRLVSVAHIDIATRHIKRLALALYMVFVVVFAKTLETEQQECFLADIESYQPDELDKNWSVQFEQFLEDGSNKNANFALHVDLMKHCSHVVSIALAERLGGPIGYTLLLAAVKESLRFSFVNSATAYAPYCVRLLYQHYSAGYFHRKLKETLFSTPIKSSNRNFACDTKRELDHQDATKGFRSGSTIESVSCRMSLIDSLNEAKESRLSHDQMCKDADDDTLGWGINEVDENHIVRAFELILRKGAISLEENSIPCNVYSKSVICLPISCLDINSDAAGEYLLYRFLAKEGMFGLTNDDVPDPGNMIGCKDILSRAKRSKGVTIKRTVKSKVHTLQTDRQIKETNRQKVVAKEKHLIDCYSSENSNCQAIVKPDSSKPKVMKAVSMQRALKSLFASSQKSASQKETSDTNDLMQLNISYIPSTILTSMTICLIEFAGIKFKVGNVKSGHEYLQQVNKMINKYVFSARDIKTIVVCEEKYSYAPDDLKAGTRAQRATKTSSVDHLKNADDIINSSTFNKEAIIKTDTGNRAISTYLAKHSHSLSFSSNFHLIIDSELNQRQTDGIQYCVPLCIKFPMQSEGTNTQHLSHIRQMKGEAEMAILDWAISFQDELKDGDTVVSLITSGDIDAVYLHLYTVCKYWRRSDAGNYKNTVYVILQKPRGKFDIYNVTEMLISLEHKFNDRNAGCKVALGLCLGGNDFFPKLHGISHEKMLIMLMGTSLFRDSLFSISVENASVDETLFVELFRRLYCPKKQGSSDMTYGQIRALTIGKQYDKNSKGGIKTNDPRRWLPPESVTLRLADLFQVIMHYMETAGKHDATMPDILENGCLVKSKSGEIEYDFGPEARFASLSDLPTVEKSAKRQFDSTPQAGKNRKRPHLSVTPIKR